MDVSLRLEPCIIMGLKLEIIDVTPLPHNGCRPPKRRRV